MQAGSYDINTGMVQLITECNKKVFRNKESVLALKHLYEKLKAERLQISRWHSGFPTDAGLNNIIIELDKLAKDKIPLKQLEWNFYHYADLFKFKAEDIVKDMFAEKNKALAEQQALTAARSQALNSLFNQEKTSTTQSKHNK
ncbi:MAG: hypothetical protein QM737_15735 [Ferruginibacter sp.]